MRSGIIFWELRRFMRIEWRVLLAFLPMGFLMLRPDRFDHLPYASSVTRFVGFGAAMVSVTFLPVLLAAAKASELPYVLSRPLDSRHIWPVRFVKFSVLSLLFSFAIGASQVRSLAAHDNQFMVRGCDALAAYEIAGFTPRFDQAGRLGEAPDARSVDRDARQRSAYSSFRAGNPVPVDSETEKGEPGCTFYASTSIPGLAGRLALITLLSSLAVSAAMVVLSTFGRRTWRDRAASPTFWLASLPSVIGLAYVVDMFLAISSMTSGERDDLGPLHAYQAAPIIITGLAVAVVSYLLLAHRAWKRIEVFE